MIDNVSDLNITDLLPSHILRRTICQNPGLDHVAGQFVVLKGNAGFVISFGSCFYIIFRMSGRVFGCESGTTVPEKIRTDRWPGRCRGCQ